ncbi:hypothetical protein C0966_00730 [Bacillus methanolicus]|uniref:hypothetical protein n=1 Tax=Bacillus methanolicus TaxID=1471 RepID=UPI00237FDD10|nr:hypothetical protein [Bacillus methanolicus]MDE3837933.1 hypothetical protein [Bacillus methanolicus]
MKTFEFAHLIEEFQVPFTYYEETEGHWEEIYYVKDDPTPVEMYGAILPLSEDDLQYAEAGTYSVKDRKIYTTQPLKLNSTIEYKGDKYTIQSFKDYSDYADVYIYLARWREKK